MRTTKTLILVGGGHAHLYFIKKLISRSIPKYKVVLISSEEFQYYSGMASSFIEGVYSLDDFRVNLRELCDKANVEFIQDEVVDFRENDKFILTKREQKINYDIISFDTGSDINQLNIKNTKKHTVSIKPLSNLIILRNILTQNKNVKCEIIIAGGGAAGLEVAFALKSLSEKLDKEFNITIIDSHTTLMGASHIRVQSKLMRNSINNKINLCLGERLVNIGRNNICLSTGKIINYDLLIIATGTQAQKIYNYSGIKVDQKGYMLVNDYLQSVNDVNVFGAGDCISLSSFDIKKNGVYAIKEASVLWKNIIRTTNGQRLIKFKPQKRFLAIYALGNGRGLLDYNGFVIEGRLVWKLKNLIDRRFITKYKIK